MMGRQIQFTPTTFLPTIDGQVVLFDLAGKEKLSIAKPDAWIETKGYTGTIVAWKPNNQPYTLRAFADGTRIMFAKKGPHDFVPYRIDDLRLDTLDVKVKEQFGMDACYSENIFTHPLIWLFRDNTLCFTYLKRDSYTQDAYFHYVQEPWEINHMASLYGLRDVMSRKQQDINTPDDQMSLWQESQ